MVHFAGRVGVSKPTLWKWEKDTVYPRQKTLRKIAHELGVSESELVYGSKRQVDQRSLDAPSVSGGKKEKIDQKRNEIANFLRVDARNVRIMIECI